jgi:hypothetical protein
VNTIIYRLQNCLVLGILLVSVGTIPLVAAPITIDFSQVPYVAFQQNNFDPSYFASSGIRFAARNHYLYYVQGAIALNSPNYAETCQQCEIAGDFLTPVSSLTVDVALNFQGVTAFALTVYDRNSDPITTATLFLDQVSGDPNFTGWGYFPISLPSIPSPAYSFKLDSQTFPGTFDAEFGAAFGASTFVFTPVISTPEPGTLLLFGSGLAVMLGRRCLRFKLPQA